MVMPQANPEPGAHIGHPGRANVPDLPGDRHSADEWKRDCRQSGGGAAGTEHTSIERRIVRGQKANIGNPSLDLGPNLSEGWGSAHILPGEAVDTCEGELPSRRTGQVVETLDNLPPDTMTTPTAHALSARGLAVSKSIAANRSPLSRGQRGEEEVSG